MYEKDLFNIKKSRKSIGQLYPVLLDSSGKYIIDGLHRLGSDHTWKKIKLSHIKDEKDIIVARIISNVCRREVSNSEKSEMFNSLSEILIRKEGIVPKNIPREISKLTGVSYRTVLRYLSDRYKDHKQSENASMRMPIHLADTLSAKKFDYIQRLRFDNYRKFVKEIEFFTFGEKKTKYVPISRCIIKPYEETDLHCHSSSYFLFCLKGKGKYRLGTKQFPIEQGMLVYFPKFIAGQLVSIGNDELDTLSFWNPPIKIKNLIFEDKAKVKL